MLRRGTGYFAATDGCSSTREAVTVPVFGSARADGAVQRDDDERQRREPMPIAACHLNKVRRMWGRCTGVQACSR